MEAWAAICDHLAVWDYTTNFSNYCSPFANFRVLRENVRIYAEHGVYYLFEQGTYNSPSGEFGDLKGYLLAKLLWDPYMSEEKYNALMDEFLADYYGAGWISLREYIDLLVESGNKKHTTIFGDPPLYFRSEEWPRITALWEEAKSKATAAQLWRIERSYSCIVQAKMSYYKYYMVRTPEFREKYFEMQEQFAAYIALGCIRKEGIKSGHIIDVHSHFSPDDEQSCCGRPKVHIAKIFVSTVMGIYLP